MPGRINSYQKIRRCMLAAILAIGVVSPIGAGSSSLGIGGIAHAGMMGWVDGLSGTAQHGFFGGENRPCGTPDFPKIVPCDPGKSSAGASRFFVPLAIAAPAMSACITIEIQKPASGDDFVFNPNGKLIIPAYAQVEPPEYSDQVVWTIDDIGKQPMTNPPMSPQGATVIFTYDGLPKNNDDFGDITIHAEVNGQKASPVTVQVFFPPDEKNNPDGKEPNWFYYWGQTRAGQGYKLKYEPQRKSESTGGWAQAQYDYYADVVVITDRVMATSCFPRHKALGGSQSTGIDCYAELVRHETQHQKERWEWWGAMNPIKLKATSDTGYRAYDMDYDLVPDEIEKKLEKSKGCSVSDPTSCDGRPRNDLFDVEMEAYWKGWEWPVGSANSEDWSECGKQWDDASGCYGGKRW